MLLNSKYMWVGIDLFIPGTLLPSLAYNMCFKKLKLNLFPTFLPLSLIDIGF